MDFKSLYLTTDGRISRKTWWIGAIVLGVINIVVSLVLLPLVGLGGPNVAALMAANSDAAALSTAMLGSIQASGWGGLIVFLIFAYPGYCLSVKRRHDKNNNGMDVIAYYVLTGLLLLVQALGLGYSVGEMNGVAVPVPSLIYSVLGFVALVGGIYLLVVLGILKGTAGANDYGPDPLSGGVAATA